jgi:hypothetical protein
MGLSPSFESQSLGSVQESSSSFCGLAFLRRGRRVSAMNTPVRIFLLLCCAAFLTSCAEDFGPSPGKKMKQEAHTNPMGQTYYTYREVDE